MVNFGRPYDKVTFPNDGKNIKHFMATVSTTVVDFFHSFWGTSFVGAADGWNGSSYRVDNAKYNPVKHMEVTVTNNGQARLLINACENIGEFEASTDRGILVDYEHPLELRMPIVICKGKRVGSTDADLEINIWY